MQQRTNIFNAQYKYQNNVTKYQWILTKFLPSITKKQQQMHLVLFWVTARHTQIQIRNMTYSINIYKIYIKKKSGNKNMCAGVTTDILRWQNKHTASHFTIWGVTYICLMWQHPTWRGDKTWQYNKHIRAHDCDDTCGVTSICPLCDPTHHSLEQGI